MCEASRVLWPDTVLLDAGTDSRWMDATGRAYSVVDYLALGKGISIPDSHRVLWTQDRQGARSCLLAGGMPPIAKRCSRVGVTVSTGVGPRGGQTWRLCHGT
jgi:hypothetical protein